MCIPSATNKFLLQNMQHTHLQDPPPHSQVIIISVHEFNSSTCLWTCEQKWSIRAPAHRNEARGRRQRLYMVLALPRRRAGSRGRRTRPATWAQNSGAGLRYHAGGSQECRKGEELCTVAGNRVPSRQATASSDQFPKTMPIPPPSPPQVASTASSCRAYSKINTTLILHVCLDLNLCSRELNFETTKTSSNCNNTLSHLAWVT